MQNNSKFRRSSQPVVSLISLCSASYSTFCKILKIHTFTISQILPEYGTNSGSMGSWPVTKFQSA